MTDPADPHYFARRAAESEAKRRRIVAEVARAAGPNDDIDYLTKRELYSAGLISSSELHATGSSELLPRGWYQHYVEAIDEYCPTRVFSLVEAGPDAADLYDRGYRWMVVFSERTGPSGDHTFIDVRSFAAAAMTDQNSLTEQAALSQIVHMGYHITDLPNDIFMTPPATIPQQPTPLPGPGWYPDPTSRFHHRWWDGQRWTHTVALHGQTHTDLDSGPRARLGREIAVELDRSRMLASRASRARCLTVRMLGWPPGFERDGSNG